MTQKSLKVIVIYGGHSAEREVSIRSGEAIIRALKKSGHEVTAVDGVQEFLKINTNHYDVAFNIIHGEAGENGELAGLLKSKQIKFTGSDVKGAVLSWHKDIAKELVAKAGLKTPQSQTVKALDELKIPTSGQWIVKPTQEGSSVGLYLAKSPQELKPIVEKALQDVSTVLVEEFIEGQECTVGIIDDLALPVVRIQPKVGLYDYDAKYESHETSYFCPSGFPDFVEQKLKKQALQAFSALSLKGWARVDFIVDANHDCWFLEANTTPGMTETSLVPKAAKACGWSFQQLVENILQTAFEESN